MDSFTGADDMTDKTSTYIYDGGAEQTVTLSRGRLVPHDHEIGRAHV